MANKEPRQQRILPTFPESTEGGIDAWVRVLRNQARTKLCFNLISRITFADRTAKERAKYRAVVVAKDAALAAGTIFVPFEDDDKAERKLLALLWAWADPKVEWASYMSCDDNAPNIGTQMWTVIT